MDIRRVEKYGPIARYESKNLFPTTVIILRNVLDFERRRRTAEILKNPGTTHMKGFHSRSAPIGVSLIPLGAMRLTQTLFQYPHKLWCCQA